MTNKVEIRVTVNGDAVPAELAAIEGETKSSTDRQKSLWDKLGDDVGSSFKRAGIAAAVGVGLGLTGPLAAAGLAVGAFGAVAAPTLEKVEQALTQTGAAGKQAYAALDPAQRSLVGSIRSLETEFGALATKLEPVVTQVLGLAVHTAGNLLPALGGLAKAGATVIDDFLTPFDKLLESPFFAQFIKQMSQLATQVGPVLGQTLTGLLKVFMQLFMQAGPAAVQVLDKLLPAIVQIATDLVPWIVGLTKVTAWLANVLDKAHLLIPVLTALGVAWLLGFGPIGLIVGALAGIVVGLDEAWQHSQTFRNVVTTVFSAVGQAVLTFASLWLSEWQTITDGFFDAVHYIMDGAEGVAKVIDAVMGTHLASAVQAASKNWANWKADVDNTFNAAQGKISQWKTDLANMPKVVALKGDISDLTAKLNSAKSQLKDPNLTATRRAQIQANIAQLEQQLAQARSLLAGINGETVTTYVATKYYSVGGTTGLKAQAHGGIVGAAGGGPRSNLTLVGEQGPELVRLPVGSTVHSNPDTQQMLAQSGSGGNLHITLELGPSFQRIGLSSEQLEDIRYTVRTVGGGNAQTAFGRH